MKKLFGFFSRIFKTNPRKRGRTVALAALLAFNSSKDTLTMRGIKSDILRFLDSGDTITHTMIKRFSAVAAEKLDVNPLAFRILVASLTDQLQMETGETNARLFILGISDALDLLGD